MKRLTTMALLLTFSVAGAYAHQAQVKMTFSGSFVRTAIDLQPDTVTDEEDFAGSGTLGPFTFRNLRTDTTGEETSPTCTTGPFVSSSTVSPFGDFACVISSDGEPVVMTPSHPYSFSCSCFLFRDLANWKHTHTHTLLNIIITCRSLPL